MAGAASPTARVPPRLWLRSKRSWAKGRARWLAGEFNDGLLGLANDISVSIAHQHHRKLGFKSKEGGLARAKAGVMRRLSMTALRSTARHVLRGLAIVGPACIHQRNDAFGADRGAPWRDPTNGG